jgi:hypothetical protein
MRRRTLLSLLGASAVAAPLQAAPPPALTVYKASGCTCCEGWVAAMRQAGFRAEVRQVDDLSREWLSRGVPNELSSCHLGVVGGYAVVGHVPPADVQRLLRERPKAVGLAVPGMPDGSPGMERPDGKKDAYNTLLLLPGGRFRVYARHA